MRQATRVTHVSVWACCHTTADKDSLWFITIIHTFSCTKMRKFSIHVMSDFPFPLARGASGSILSLSEYFQQKPKVNSRALIFIFCWGEGTVCKTSRMRTPTCSVMVKQVLTLDDRAHTPGDCHVDSCSNPLLRRLISIPCAIHKHG